MFTVQRLGTIMQGAADDPHEAWGVLNPATCRGRDGELYLFARAVAADNYSRIGIARVVFNGDGVPTGVERLGYALEPTEGYELNDRGGGGVEDARVTFVAPLDTFLMTYTAYGPYGPRIALAASDDLRHWRRLGPVKFRYEPHLRTDLDLFPNKDALIFPEAILDPQGRPALAMLHRPSFELWGQHAPNPALVPAGVADIRPSIWISYCPLGEGTPDLDALTFYRDHAVLATPQYAWEQLKIGGGTPPVRTHLGWLTLYHGVTGEIDPELDLQLRVFYSAAALILDGDDPTIVRYRSADPLFTPETPGETKGIVNNVVFPTGVDVRDARTIDVYYGMADARIGAVRVTLPDELPS